VRASPARDAAAAGALALGLVLPACARLPAPLGPPPPAWEAPVPPPETGPVVPGERLHREVLENGLQVIALEDRSLPRVALGVTIPRGAAREPRERAGVASFTAELMRRGAGERDALALARAVDGLGASLASSADWDAAAVRISGLSRDAETLAGILADVVLRPRLAEEDAARLRSQRLAALARAVDEPGTLGRWHLARALYPEHRYGLPEPGTPETARRLDAGAARAHHAAAWRPAGAVFFAAGDLGGAEAAALARRLFGDWSGAPAPPPAPPPPERTPEARRVVVVDRPVLEQAHILVGHEGIPRTAPDRVAVQIMNQVIGGGGFSSRLMSRVRESQGLAYFAYSGFTMRREGGAFTAATATRVPEAGRAAELVLEVLEAGREKPPTDEEISLAKAGAAGRFALGLETSEALVSQLVELEVYGLPRDSLDTYRSRVVAVTPADVRRAAEAYLHPARAALVVVGPAEALVPQLEGLGPVEVVDPRQPGFGLEGASRSGARIGF